MSAIICGTLLMFFFLLFYPSLSKTWARGKPPQTWWSRIGGVFVCSCLASIEGTKLTREHENQNYLFSMIRINRTSMQENVNERRTGNGAATVVAKSGRCWANEELKILIFILFYVMFWQKNEAESTTIFVEMVVSLNVATKIGLNQNYNVRILKSYKICENFFQLL